MLENRQNAPLLDTLLCLDDQPDVAELLRFVQGGAHDLEEMLLVIPALLVQKRLRPAYILALLLKNNGYHNPILSSALSLGGWIFGNPEEERFGLESLRIQADALPPAQRHLLYDAMLQPLLTHVLTVAIERADRAAVLKILALYKLFFPSLRTLFDVHAPVPAFSLEEVRQRGRAQARLLVYPPETLPRSRRRVVVAMRERFYFGNSSSRPSDFGPRLEAAMQAYGWEVIGCPFRCATLTDMTDDFRAIVAACRQHQAELLVMDLNVTMKAEERDAMIFQLRQENPAMRVVGCLIDSFCFSDAVLTQASQHLDLVWTRDAPARPLWSTPFFVDRTLNLAFPQAGLVGIPDRPLVPQLFFSGGITGGYTPHRAFWWATVEQLGLPVSVRLSSHGEDGLSPLDSFAVYMQGLAAATCCLNFSMRADHSHVVTFRSFEVLFSGALLVQEATAEMDYYFIAGEHYLPFATLAELAAVVRFMTEHPDEAEAIRRCGNAFARERYSDERIIGCLERRVWG
ncbi:MAG: glycosyltransferase family 1 protein [Magnetococcales bacterium]|nr:glycosyltransferase family 1 protein [Magnetococcales bacterium]